MPLDTHPIAKVHNYLQQLIGDANILETFRGVRNPQGQLGLLLLVKVTEGHGVLLEEHAAANHLHALLLIPDEFGHNAHVEAVQQVWV
jgi:hypothetical protein